MTHCKITQDCMTYLVLTEGFSIIVCKNVSAYFIFIYSHKTRKCLPRISLQGLLFQLSIKKKLFHQSFFIPKF